MSAGGEDDDLLAAELALGLLDKPERGDAEARLARDPDLARAYARWQERAAGLFADHGETPSAAVWAAIDARLPANDSDKAMATAPTTSAKLRLWQAATLAASLAAIVLGYIALQKPAQTPSQIVAASPSAPIVAVLTGKQGLVTISFDRSTGRLTSAASGLAIGNNVPQLWVIPADGKPRSLGLISARSPSWIKTPAPGAAALAPGVTIAISVEPIGGSPTGQPTGPVILSGKMVES
jgi:anti-sigma-K factor RskA